MAAKDRIGRSFHLIEVLVALAILVVTLTVMIRAFSTGLRGTGIAERYAMATILVRSDIDEVGVDIPLVEGQQSGIAENGFSWTTRVALNMTLVQATPPAWPLSRGWRNRR